MAEQSRKPIILHVGSIKSSKKRIRELKNGEGKLAEEVQAAILQAHPDLAAAGGEVLPVVLLVEEKRRKKKAGRRSALFRMFDI